MKPAHQGDTTACRHTGMQGRSAGGGRRQEAGTAPALFTQSIAPGVLSPSGGSGVRDGARGVGVGEKGARRPFTTDGNGKGTAAGSSEIGLPAEPNSALC